MASSVQSRVEENTQGAIMATPPNPINLDVATFVDDEVCLFDASEDTVDGMATIGESTDKDIRFFGTAISS